MNKKKIVIISVIVLVVVSIILALRFKGNNIENNNDNIQDNLDNLSQQEENNNNGLVEEPSFEESNDIYVTVEDLGEGPFPDEHPEIDWEEPPVLTYYNEEADTNNDGHVEKAEWEVWIANHPEDLNQDMVITTEELEAYQSDDDSKRIEIQPTYSDDIKAPTEEELKQQEDENRQMWESEGQGLAGMDKWAEENGNPDFDPSAGGAIEVAPGLWEKPNMNVN